MPTTHERITGFPLLAGLSRDHIDLLTSAATKVGYVKRQRLFFQDEPAIGCWLVLAGRVAIDSLVLGRGHEVVTMVGPGEIAGWSWLVPPYRWRFGAVALTSVEALRLDTGYLRTVMAHDPEFGLAITEAMLAVAEQRLMAVDARFAERYRPARH
ncbi:MAG TPA: cyclic nucleotide-binding domain-containing protein [Pseudonocardiaceae bacterium]|nr:cyclic nucleotide-binding domain-containing protein [Pseudonocardiaceae bacterium]